MGLQGAANWMIEPMRQGPINDKSPAGQLEAKGNEEKYSPAIAHLLKHSCKKQKQKNKQKTLEKTIL